MISTIGREGNLLDCTPEQARLLRLETPVITNAQCARIKALGSGMDGDGISNSSSSSYSS